MKTIAALVAATPSFNVFSFVASTVVSIRLIVATVPSTDFKDERLLVRLAMLSLMVADCNLAVFAKATVSMAVRW